MRDSNRNVISPAKTAVARPRLFIDPLSVVAMQYNEPHLLNQSESFSNSKEVTIEVHSKFVDSWNSGVENEKNIPKRKLLSRKAYKRSREGPMKLARQVWRQRRLEAQQLKSQENLNLARLGIA